MKELVEIQNKLKAPKGQYNSFGKYKYRSCEDILEAVKPLLYVQNCRLTLSDEVVSIGDRIYVKSTATITNGNGEAVVTTGYAREEEVKKGMDGSQITGASSSYARKYALNGMFCIDDTKDSDVTNNGEIPSASKNEIDKVIKEIRGAKSIDELSAIYSRNNNLHDNMEFMSVLAERKKKLM